jgi:hypothetical protein
MAKQPIEYSETQQKVIDRYMEATKDFPESRIPISKLIGMKHRIPSARPDKSTLQKCEEDFLEETVAIMGRPKRQIDNNYVKSVFYKYQSYKDAKKQFYWLDDILVGVSRLDMGGNTRPLGTGVLYSFICSSNIINTSIIQDFCNVGVRQSQNIMAALVIANRMIEKELLRMGFEVDV